MLAAAAAVKRVLILTFFVAPPPNPPPRSATRYRHYLRGQNLRIVFQGVAQFSNGLLGCCTIIFQDVAKFSDCLPRFCTIFRLSSKMLQNFLTRCWTNIFQDFAQNFHGPEIMIVQCVESMHWQTSSWAWSQSALNSGSSNVSQSHQWSGCFNASEKFTENNWEELTQINQAQATKHKSNKLKQPNTNHPSSSH